MERLKQLWKYLGTKLWFKIPLTIIVVVTFPIWVPAFLAGFLLLLICIGAYEGVEALFWPKPKPKSMPEKNYIAKSRFN